MIGSHKLPLHVNHVSFTAKLQKINLDRKLALAAWLDLRYVEPFCLICVLNIPPI